MAGDLKERAKKMAQEQYKGVKKAVLAYSGGLDSNVIGHLLCEIGIEVTSVSIDMGQKDAKESAKKPGFAQSHMHVDAKAELHEAISRGVKANCLHEGHLNSGGISRPVIAQMLVQAARKCKADAIAHGSSGIGNDQIRMENALRVLGPEFRVLAPVRDFDVGRDEALAYAKENSLAVDLARVKKYSVDENMWARTIRQGSVLDQSVPIPEDAFEWTVAREDAPDEKEYVEITFENGIPIGVCHADEKRNVVCETENAIEYLNKAGGAHAIGRLDSIDDKIVGLKTREIYECPAALMISKAHRDLERLTLTASELDAKSWVDRTWNRIVYYGGWHTRVRRYLDAFIDESQRVVDGKVTIEMYKGGFSIVGRKSENALYDARLGSRESSGVWDQAQARHFAKLYGLQDTIAYLIND